MYFVYLLRVVPGTIIILLYMIVFLIHARAIKKQTGYPKGVRLI